MASINVDIGLGRTASLAARLPAGGLTVQQRLDAQEFLRRWPKLAGGSESHNARGYVQRLRLRATSSTGRDDAVKVLREAVERGRVVVTISRTSLGSAGGSSTSPRATPRRMAVAAGPSFEPYSAMASDGGVSMSVPIGGAGIGGDLLSNSVENASLLLDGAMPFSLSDVVSGIAEQIAGVFLTPAEELECEVQYNLDMEECSAWYAMKPSSWGMCKDRAMQRYANCLRGFG